MIRPIPTETRILVLHDAPNPHLESLRRRFPDVQIEICQDAELAPSIAASLRPQIIFSWKGKGIPGEVQRPIFARPEVKWVQIANVGFDHLHPLPASSTPFTNCVGVLTEFMGECVIGAILMMNFRFHNYIHQQKSGQWHYHPWTSLSGKTALIIGLGHIGRNVAMRAKQMGMHIIGIRNSNRATPEVDEQFPMTQLHELLPKADFVCVHVPLTDATRGLIDAAAFKQMAPHAILINTARGGIVDEASMLDALQSGQIAGAYVDTFEMEPLPPENPLWQLENLVITPHISDSVVDWEERFIDFFAVNLERWFHGEALLNRVDVARGY